MQDLTPFRGRTSSGPASMPGQLRSGCTARTDTRRALARRGRYVSAERYVHVEDVKGAMDSLPKASRSR
jgi:hypothetical protein